MKRCDRCDKQIDDNALFCPYCGEKLMQHDQPVSDDDVAGENGAGSGLVVKKAVSKKALLKIAAAILVVVMVGVVTFCEVKISDAKKLYAQGEYWEAYFSIRNIPTLGREEVIRIKTAAFAGDNYQSYLITKRIRLSSTSSKSKDAYQDAFFELVFGLYLDLKWSKDEQLNDIERSEYQKFIDLFYRELKSMFFMSDDEITALIDAFASANEVADMHTIANEWLEENFFD